MTARTVIRDFGKCANIGAATTILGNVISGINSSITVTFWLKLVRGAVTRSIFTNVVSASDRFGIVVLGTGHLSAGYYNGTSYTGKVSSGARIDDNQWHRCSVTWNGTTATLYINGVQQTGITQPIIQNTTGLSIGCDTSGTAPLRGYLDELCVYAAVLSVEEQELSLNGAVTNARAYFKFNDTVTDSSGNGVTVTPTNLTYNTETPIPSRAVSTSRTTIGTLSAPLTKAKITIIFDDGGESVATVGYPYMDSLGLVGSVAINSATIDTVDYMTTAQCTTLHNAGWTMMNHTENHLYVSSLSPTDALSEYTGCRDWLIANGFSDGAEHVIFPYNSTTPAINQAYIDAGAKTLGGISKDFNGSPTPIKYLYSRSAMSNVTTATFQERIDAAIAGNHYLHLYYHYLRDPGLYGTTSTLPADFEDQMDYLKTKVDAGLIDVVNFADAYTDFFVDSVTPRVQSRDMGTLLRFISSNSDKVDIDSVTSKIDVSEPMSLSAWFKCSGTAQQTILSLGNNSGINPFVLVDVNFSVPGRVRFSIRGDAGGTSYIDCIYAGSYNDRRWHHVVAVKENDAAKLYIDGMHLTSVPFTYAATTINVAAIGVLKRSTLSSYFNGIIDEPRIWNRALTPTEIQNLYLYGIVPQDGLVAEYLFNEGSGTTALDTSGNGNNGTITGATYTTDVPLKPRV